MTPEAIIDEVRRARLRGRGGGGFSTGRKWDAVPRGADVPRQKYLVVNADEMEPGSFKDRLLLERTPHPMIESVIISAFAIQADTAYIFVRAEYVLSIRRLSRAVAEAEARGYVGANILFLGSDFAFCDLAPGAMQPLASGLKHFRKEFDQHISEKRCPWRETAGGWA
jgi:NADH-quinone oxidoreductase subunit F